MNTAITRARDKVKLEPAYRNATTAEQEAMLEETKLEVQRKRYAAYLKNISM
jgi:thiazole synthase ThiGH ThiG subunit